MSEKKKAICEGWVISAINRDGLFWSESKHEFSLDAMTIFEKYGEACDVAKHFKENVTIWPVLYSKYTSL